MEPPPAKVLLSEPQVSCCGVNLETEACPHQNEVGVFQVQLFWAIPRDLSSTGRSWWVALHAMIQVGCTPQWKIPPAHGQRPSAFILKQLAEDTANRR